MKLYDSRLAPNPRRVRWLMAEKGIDDIEIVETDLLAGAHKTPGFLKTVGFAAVPALTLDDGTTITESLAICRYLEALNPEPNLFGRDAREAAVIEMWTRRAEMLAATPLMLAVRHGHPALAALETQRAEIGAYNRAAAEKSLAFFDERLNQTAFIGADRVTMADGVLFVAMEFARLIRFRIPDALERLTAWQSAMRERASASAGT